MTKRARVPAPDPPRELPSIIRSTGPRFVLLVAGMAAVVVLGGGSYLLSRITADAPKHAVTAASKSSVLGDSTTKASSATPADTSASTPTVTQTTANPDGSTTTTCVSNCSATPQTTTTPPTAKAKLETPSFDLTVDTSTIHPQGLTISVPFHVVRHGGLTAPVVPGDASIMSGGLLTNLLTVQSEKMIDADNGVLTLLAVNLSPRSIDVHLSASAGNLLASTSFSYKIKS